MNDNEKTTDHRHEHFMGLALKEAQKALAAGEFPVGCVLVADDKVLATGVRTGSSGPSPNELDHAEIVAIRNLNGFGAGDRSCRITAYCTMEPCLMCFAALMLSGVGQIVYAYEDAMGGGTSAELFRLAPLYANCKITIMGGVCRKQSLALFKKFFSDPNNRYWQKSLLAEYTLSQ